MSDVVIRVENLSKHYRLGQISGGTLREDLQRWWASVRGRPDPLQKVDGNSWVGTGEHWALTDVNFDVRQGEVLGIIGRNGAGKSTLLKILSRTTAPTKGSVRIKGRIASLLEVGTGFHPELSGRDNIYLNGAILGMKKAEIDRKLDEIIDFSGIEIFIDTPVKRYSSGMYVRLAFAVAAHLEPEILILDEVLAVGDTEFQAKCLGKMEKVSREGRTVIFVSHNMGAISQLCNKGILLNSGILKLDGSVEDCIKTYLTQNKNNTAKLNCERKSKANQKLLIQSIEIKNNDNSTSLIDNSLVTTLDISLEVFQPGSNYAIAVELMNRMGEVILCTSTLDSRPKINNGFYPEKGRYSAKLNLPTSWLLEGDYSLRVAATIPAVEILDIFPEEMNFTVHDSSSPVAILGEGRRGVVAPRLDWMINKIY